MHTAGAKQETERSNPSDEAWGKVTAEVRELLRWTPEDSASNGRAATIQCCSEPGETTESDEGAREAQQSNDGQPTEHRASQFES